MIQHNQIGKRKKKEDLLDAKKGRTFVTPQNRSYTILDWKKESNKYFLTLQFEGKDFQISEKDFNKFDTDTMLSQLTDINSFLNSVSKNRKQKSNINQAGSFMNNLMSNNQTLPKAGEYATILHYSDRDVAIVKEVSSDYKTVVIEDCHFTHGWDGYAKDYSLSGHSRTIVWKHGKWRQVTSVVEFEKSFLESIPVSSVAAWLKKNNPELFEKIYGEHVWPCNVVEGVTRIKKEYAPVRILFGKADGYRDPHF